MHEHSPSAAMTGADGAGSLQRLAAGLFFIVGVPRSGTTLLQAMLTSHPEIGIPPETEFFMKHRPPAACATDERAWQRYLSAWFAAQGFVEQDIDPDAMRARLDRLAPAERTERRVFLELLATHAERSGKRRVGEKSPHHCRHVESIARLFPEAKFIHILRDPRDVVASLKRVPWSQGSHLTLARGWKRILEDHRRLLREMPGDQYTGVSYEDLVFHPERELGRLCAFLGEELRPEMLNFHERRDRGFAEREAAWKGGTMRPINASSIGRYASDLSPREIAGVERVVGPLLKEFGYEPAPIHRSALWPVADFGIAGGEVVTRFGRSVRKRLGGLSFR